MSKRALTLMLTAALSLAGAQTGTPALSDARLARANVSLELGQRTPLSVTLTALARSAGYDVVFDVNVDALPAATGATAPTLYSFQNKPFNEVWPLLMDVYGLNYSVVQVGGRDVLRVSNTPVQRVVALKNATAADLEARVRSFLPNARIVADARTNSLLVSGTNRELAELDRIVAELDRPVAGAPAPVTEATVQRVVALQNATAADLEPRVRTFFPNLRIVADVRTNSLVVSGTERELTSLGELVAQLDRPVAPAVPVTPVTPATPPTPPPPPVVQRTLNLQNAQAADVETRLRALFPNLRVVADPRTNSLLLSATEAELADVNTVVTQLDRAVGQTSTQAPDPTLQRVYSVQGTSEDIVAFLRTTYPTLTVTPVGRTGQLVVSGPTSVVNAAFTLLGQVDRPVPVVSGPAVVQRVFTLANAQAIEVKAVLEGTLAAALRDATTTTPLSGTGTDASGNPTTTTGTASAQGQAQSSTAQAAQTAAASNATIIADQRTNTLVVRGTAAQVAQVAELIPVLDVRVPQINVQIRIQEVDETATRTLGLDWSAGFGNFVTRLVSGNLAALFDNTTNNVGGLNLGATLRALEDQQRSKNVYDGNVTLQSGQRRQGNTGTVESSSANAAASVRSGGRIELNIPSTSGNIVRQIDYGVLLDFLNPQVSSDGTITIGVRSTVSTPTTTLTGTSIPNILAFTNREANTTVSFRSGQTILLGGLLTDTQTNGSQGVPFLSSIPIIGNLFKQENTRTQRAQLLIVLTGNIVQ